MNASAWPETSRLLKPGTVDVSQKEVERELIDLGYIINIVFFL